MSTHRSGFGAAAWVPDTSISRRYHHVDRGAGVVVWNRERRCGIVAVERCVAATRLYRDGIVIQVLWGWLCQKRLFISLTDRHLLNTGALANACATAMPYCLAAWFYGITLRAIWFPASLIPFRIALRTLQSPSLSQTARATVLGLCENADQRLLIPAADLIARSASDSIRCIILNVTRTPSRLPVDACEFSLASRCGAVAARFNLQASGPHLVADTVWNTARESVPGGRLAASRAGIH